MVHVEAEIGQMSVPASGHCYVVLRDNDATLRAVVWRSVWQQVRHRPRQGDRVLCRGRIDVFVARGDYQLYITDMVPAGQGDLARVIAARKSRLMAEGLLDARRKRLLPRYPRFVGLVTSPTGAALHDFLEVSRTRYPAARILLAGCRVQGDLAPPTVIRAMELLIEDGRAEVIVVTRGGGAKEDLMPFQDEQLARFIAHSPIPVVSAVGHQIDTTLADLVADGVAPTPSAAAALVLPDGPAIRQRTDEVATALHAGMARRLSADRARLAALEARLRHPGQRLVEIRERARAAQVRLERTVASRLAGWRRDVAALEQRLLALSPTAVLERGYALVTHDGLVVTHPDQVPAGARIDVRTAGGDFEATRSTD
jgi:exodeoxyribonuclease VII large subunit